jgi:hypothetical protein
MHLSTPRPRRPLQCPGLARHISARGTARLLTDLLNFDLRRLRRVYDDGVEADIVHSRRHDDVS